MPPLVSELVEGCGDPARRRAPVVLGGGDVDRTVWRQMNTSETAEHRTVRDVTGNKSHDKG